ncbi:putative Cytochrome P450 ClCP1 [Seiridium cardinale]|uniref:Cytochrome P450 ClCP1 n=1 Tax=Seiridium cardinale TaxID=138064 RepID=A0ABR2XJ82_9PEZI
MRTLGVHSFFFFFSLICSRAVALGAATQLYRAMASLLPVILGNAVTALAALVTLITLYVSSRIAYNVFFHPLRSFPGPFSHRATILPWAYYIAKGGLAWHVAELHERYGPVVRITPGELSFLEPEAWRDVYTARPSGEHLEKYIPFYRPAGTSSRSIVSAEKEEHSMVRKLLAPSFSDKAMREVEPTVGRYVDSLLRQVTRVCDDGKAAVNMRDWYNFTTFDVIGNLAFGEDFGCLEGGDYHPWVASIVLSIRENALALALSSMLSRPIIRLIAKRAGKGRRKYNALSHQKLQRRIDRDIGEPDIIGRLIDKKDELNLSFETLRSNSGALTIAGSETTATLLTGVTYLLLTRPDCLLKATNEIRSSFQSTEEITFTSVNGLTYMLACLNEALRIYPPAPHGLPRVTPTGGATIAGTFVPGNNVVSVPTLAMQRSKRYFRLPDEFHPERFLGDASFAGDRLDAIQPFSLGPRNCIGKPLAYAEMRLILAKILFSFDLRLADDSKNWIDRNKVYFLWLKPDLNVYLTPARSSKS